MQLPPTPASLDDYEQLAWEHGYGRVAGIDEAGRGPLAGPVVAAAVILPRDQRPEGLNDSKALTARQRQSLYDCLHGESRVHIGVAVVSPADIDRHNILRATHMAMRAAVASLSPLPDLAFVDGLPVPEFPCPSVSVVKGDAKCACIAAASIIAKVTRDRAMVALDRDYPVYGFAQHKGYGTAAHLEALQRHGPCPAHRRSFRPVSELLEAGPRQREFEFMQESSGAAPSAL